MTTLPSKRLCPSSRNEPSNKPANEYVITVESTPGTIRSESCAGRFELHAIRRTDGHEQGAI
jgi:hypothetical protein